MPVLAQWPIYPAADPGKGYPSKEDFGEGYMLTQPSMDWFEECYCADESDWRYAPLVKSQAGMPPTLVTTASLDPIRDQGRAYAAACIEAGVRTTYHRGGGDGARLHQPAPRHPFGRRRHPPRVAALKLLLSEVADDEGHRSTARPSR